MPAPRVGCSFDTGDSNQRAAARTARRGTPRARSSAGAGVYEPQCAVEAPARCAQRRLCKPRAITHVHDKLATRHPRQRNRRRRWSSQEAGGDWSSFTCPGRRTAQWFVVNANQHFYVLVVGGPRAAGLGGALLETSSCRCACRHLSAALALFLVDHFGCTSRLLA